MHNSALQEAQFRSIDVRKILASGAGRWYPFDRRLRTLLLGCLLIASSAIGKSPPPPPPPTLDDLVAQATHIFAGTAERIVFRDITSRDAATYGKEYEQPGPGRTLDLVVKVHRVIYPKNELKPTTVRISFGGLGITEPSKLGIIGQRIVLLTTELPASTLAPQEKVFSAVALPLPEDELGKVEARGHAKRTRHAETLTPMHGVVILGYPTRRHRRCP